MIQKKLYYVKKNVMNNYDDVFKPIKSFTNNKNDHYYDLDNFYLDTYKEDLTRVKKK